MDCRQGQRAVFHARCFGLVTNHTNWIIIQVHIDKTNEFFIKCSLSMLNAEIFANCSILKSEFVGKRSEEILQSAFFCAQSLCRKYKGASKLV